MEFPTNEVRVPTVPPGLPGLGAIRFDDLPHDPLRRYTSDPVNEPATLALYPGADGAAKLYDEDEISFDYRQNEGWAWRWPGGTPIALYRCGSLRARACSRRSSQLPRARGGHHAEPGGWRLGRAVEIAF